MLYEVITNVAELPQLCHCDRGSDTVGDCIQHALRDLQRVVSFFVDNGTLYLELPYDSGTMKFRPEGQHS